MLIDNADATSMIHPPSQRSKLLKGVERRGSLLTGGLEIPGVLTMTTLTFAPSAPPVAIPVGEVLPWAIFAGLMLMIAIYFVGAEQGATSLIKGMYVHEFLHDGRHLLGFPCH
jgi:Probable cobalt transporter subunit (CbtB)